MHLVEHAKKKRGGGCILTRDGIVDFSPHTGEFIKLDAYSLLQVVCISIMEESGESCEDFAFESLAKYRWLRLQEHP